MSYVKNIFNPITWKSAGYAVWFMLISWLMTKVQEVGLYDNSQGSRCDYESWTDGQIYQWIWDGQPCAYTAEFLIGYIYFLALYLLFDYVRRKIAGVNPAIRWRITEVCVWFALYWGCLLFLTITELTAFNLTLFGNSFLGTLLFFAPLLGAAVGTNYLKSRAELWILGLIIAFCTVLYIVFGV